VIPPACPACRLPAGRQGRQAAGRDFGSVFAIWTLSQQPFTAYRNSWKTKL